MALHHVQYGVMTFGGKAWRCTPFKKTLKVMTLGDKAWRCIMVNRTFKVMTVGGKARRCIHERQTGSLGRPRGLEPC